MHSNIIGEDSLGPFFLCRDTTCPLCGKECIHTIEYKRTPNVTSYVKMADSLLLKMDSSKGGIRLHRKVGINCGCYAKVHRQIKAIELGQRRKAVRKMKQGTGRKPRV